MLRFQVDDNRNQGHLFGQKQRRQLVHVSGIARMLLLFVLLLTMSACQSSSAGADTDAPPDAAAEQDLDVNQNADTPQDAATDLQMQSESAELRIGFPVATLINGHIGQVLDKTEVLEKQQINSTINTFPYGSPMMEALAANKIDVALTTDGPSTLLLSKGIPANIIASLGTLRSGLMVLGDSDIQTVADLKGLEVAVPFGSTPHMHLLRWLRNADLNPDEDVTVINLATGELEPSLASGSVDAIVFWEPNVTQVVNKTNARVIESDELTSIVIMRKEFLDEHRDIAQRFVLALADASLYMATHKDEVNGWFSEAARTESGIVHEASLYSPSYAEVEQLQDINLGLTDDVMATLNASADFLIEIGSAEERVNIDDAVVPSLWEEALATREE